MSRPFPTNIQLLDSKKLIKDRAKNKLGLDNTNLPFGWVKGCKMHCKKETDIIGTWFTKTADCVPMWFNLTTFMVGLFIRLVQCSRDTYAKRDSDFVEGKNSTHDYCISPCYMKTSMVN